MTTPLQQFKSYIYEGVEPSKIEPEISMLIGMLISIEARYILDMRTKDERRAALETLPELIRRDVQSAIMSIWSDSKQKNRP